MFSDSLLQVMCTVSWAYPANLLSNPVENVVLLLFLCSAQVDLKHAMCSLAALIKYLDVSCHLFDTIQFSSNDSSFCLMNQILEHTNYLLLISHNICAWTVLQCVPCIWKRNRGIAALIISPVFSTIAPPLRDDGCCCNGSGSHCWTRIKSVMWPCC